MALWDGVSTYLFEGHLLLGVYYGVDACSSLSTVDTAGMPLLTTNEFVCFVHCTHIPQCQLHLGNSTNVTWILMGLLSEQSKTARLVT